MFYTLRWRGWYSYIFRLYVWLRSKAILSNSRALGFASKFMFWNHQTKSGTAQVKEDAWQAFESFCQFLNSFLVFLLTRLWSSVYGQRITHWIYSFFLHLFLFKDSLLFYTLRCRGLHSSIFRFYLWFHSK